MAPQNRQTVNSLPHNNFTRRLVSSRDKREVGSCSIKVVGLEKFIRRIIQECNLRMTEVVEFNLNERGVLYKWQDVFNIEQTYTKCLGISGREYSCHAFTHEPMNGLAYFVLEEFNKRSYSFLPEFKFHVMIFCWYDTDTKAVTKVSVQYDQHSFFLHCMGIEGLWRWTIANVLTPPARLWARAYMATGMVNPVTFLAQIFFFAWGISKILS